VESIIAPFCPHRALEPARKQKSLPTQRRHNPVPYAGITQIRFLGFVLRLPASGRSPPRYFDVNYVNGNYNASKKLIFYIISCKR